MDIPSLLARLPIERFKQPAPVVAVVHLSGVIGAMGPLRVGLTLASLVKPIERAFKLPRLKAVALIINSPGGSPVQSDLIAQHIRDLAKEKQVPVIAFCEDVAASGGYWLACAADEIFAHEASIVGSIGVISAGFGFPQLLERWGVERRVHTAGAKKSMLDPFQAEKPEDVKRLKTLHKEIHESFMTMVGDRRGDRLKGTPQTLFSGEFWTGKKALELGLIDGLGNLRQVMRARFGEKVQLRRVDGERPWWRRRFGLGLLERFSGEMFSGSANGSLLPENWASGLLSAAEERALWSRYGL